MALRSGVGLLSLLALVALLAPCLAGERPLMALSDEGVSFPAFRSLLSPLPRSGATPPEPAPSWSLGPPIGHDPLDVDLVSRLRPPGARHWLGTDELGRDILSRLVHASRPSLIVALLSTVIALALGVPIGAAAGYAGGRVDVVLSRLIEASLSFPMLVLLLLLTALSLQVAPVGATAPLTSLLVVGGAVGIAHWAVIARYMRGEVLRLAGTDLAIAARASGAGPLRVLTRHLIPVGFTPVAIAAAFGAGSAVVAEASLSFLGMGVQPPAPTWGQMIAVAADLGARYWWMLVFPGAMMAMVVAGFNLVAEGIRRRGAS